MGPPLKYLLDTHVLIWLRAKPGRIRPATMETLADRQNDVYISAVSFWEMATKFRLGKLPAAGLVLRNLSEMMDANGFHPLSISLAHGKRAGSYEADNQDPFDRILAAQAELEALVLVSDDGKLAGFPCRTLW